MSLNFNFRNTYSSLSEKFYSRTRPVAVARPGIFVFNSALAIELGLDPKPMNPEQTAQLLSGNLLPEGADPIALAYAGHQFGHFTMLGDGRAHLLGEHVAPNGRRWDVQFKGSGPTTFSRGGDGRAALGPMLREYILSEAMAALGIPTSRSLAVVKTGELVHRETPQPGAVLTRVAASHLRVGTFEYAWAAGGKDAVKELADYAIERHFPELAGSTGKYREFLDAVCAQQVVLIARWMAVGFIHGVMNTDNTFISGETLDYGPCAFMDEFDPQATFSSIDRRGRYAYVRQPAIAQWNLARFAETLLPLLSDSEEDAKKIASDLVNGFSARFEDEWGARMGAKLGFFDRKAGDSELIGDFLQWVHEGHRDFTNTFREFSRAPEDLAVAVDDPQFQTWFGRWNERVKTRAVSREDADLRRRMLAENPDVIPRNHQVEAVLVAAVERDEDGPLHALLAALKNPFSDDSSHEPFRRPPSAEERVHHTFCGT